MREIFQSHLPLFKWPVENLRAVDAFDGQQCHLSALSTTNRRCQPVQDGGHSQWLPSRDQQSPLPLEDLSSSWPLWVPRLSLPNCLPPTHSLPRQFSDKIAQWRLLRMYLRVLRKLENLPKDGLSRSHTLFFSPSRAHFRPPKTDIFVFSRVLCFALRNSKFDEFFSPSPRRLFDDTVRNRCACKFRWTSRDNRYRFLFLRFFCFLFAMFVRKKNLFKWRKEFTT